jgi:hypothetical protein
MRSGGIMNKFAAIMFLLVEGTPSVVPFCSLGGD